MEDEAEFRAATRKERLCFAAECGLGGLGHRATKDGLEQPHEKNGLVLLQNVDPGSFRAATGPVLLQNVARPLWAHTSTRGSIF